MSTLIPLILLIGAVLGMRFKVLILIHTIGFALIAILAGGIVRGDSASAILIAAVLAWICLQIGYLCGIMTRYSIAMARARRTRKVSLQARAS
jgi:hypothetical protein